MLPTYDAAVHATLMLILGRMCDESTRLGLPGVAAVGFHHPDAGLVSLAKVRGALIGDDANYLAIAYSKLAEMCETLQASGSGARPPYRGEFAYVGGDIITVEHGHYIAAFSGATSEEDLAISHHGLASLALSGK